MCEAGAAERLIAHAAVQTDFLPVCISHRKSLLIKPQASFTLHNDHSFFSKIKKRPPSFPASSRPALIMYREKADKRKGRQA